MPSVFVRVRTEESTLHPSDIVSLPPGSTHRALDDLRQRSLPELDALMRLIETRTGCKSESSEKTHHAAIAKTQRPEVLAGKPWMTLLHLRDYLRFRTRLKRVDDFTAVMEVFEERQNAGAIGIVKVDVGKLLLPREFGWRMIAVDIRLGTGMLVEHYMTFDRLIDVNERWLHKLYERWRGTQPIDFGELRERKTDADMSVAAYQGLFVERACASLQGGTAITSARQASLNQLDALIGARL